MKWPLRKAEDLIIDRDIVYSLNKYRETDGIKVMPTRPCTAVRAFSAQRPPGRIRPQRCPAERAGEHDSGHKRRGADGHFQQAPLPQGKPGDPADRPSHVQAGGGGHTGTPRPTGPSLRILRRRVP